MNFEIDVSGEDLLNKDYTICLASKDGSMIKGFKFKEELVNVLSSKYGQGLYKRYRKSAKGKALFKVRLYCIIVFNLLQSIPKNKISLTLCRDFSGWEKEIKETIISFLKKISLQIVNEIYFDRLPNESNAHKYAYLMRQDTKDKMSTYIYLKLEEIEKWLIK